jgi:hypothetical protein
MKRGKIENKVRKNGGNAKKLSSDSLKWFYTQIKSTASAFPKNAFNPMKHPFIGGMFHFIYDPKWKEQLPYWDKFPLVIPIEMYNDGFLGLNLHYLPPILRAKLLDALLELKEKSSTNQAYMRVSYKILRGVVKQKLFEPCLKRYLSNHIISKIISISDESWEEVAFLPTQQFQKASQKDVWRDAR